MTRYNVGIVFLVAGGLIFTVRYAAGAGLVNSAQVYNAQSTGMPTWYPGFLIDLDNALPNGFNLEYALAIIGGGLIWL